MLSLLLMFSLTHATTVITIPLPGAASCRIELVLLPHTTDLAKSLAGGFLPPQPAFKLKFLGAPAKAKGIAFPLTHGHANNLRESEGVLLSHDVRNDPGQFNAEELETLKAVEEFLNGQRAGSMFNLRYLSVEAKGLHLDAPLFLIIPEAEIGAGEKVGLLVRFFSRDPAEMFLPNRTGEYNRPFHLSRVRIEESDRAFESYRVKFEETTTEARLRPMPKPKPSLGRRVIVIE